MIERMQWGALLLGAWRAAADRRMLAGVVIGAAAVVSAVSVAEDAGGWLSGMLPAPAGPPAGTPFTAPPVVAEALARDAAACPATGVGAAIREAVEVRSKLAVAGPDVERLFDVGGSGGAGGLLSGCFGDSIYDLSFAIPSLESIMGAVRGAMQRFVKRKVCTAYRDATRMVTGPIREASRKINEGRRVLNDDIGGVLGDIDPDLGGEYRNAPAAGETYKVNPNGFGGEQLMFEGVSSVGNAAGSALGGFSAQITSLTQQMASQQIRINQSEGQLANAQGAFNACQGSATGAGCGAQFAALQAAQQQVSGDRSAMISLQTQMSQVVPLAEAPAAAPVASAARTEAPSNAPSAPANGGSGEGWLERVSNLFGK